ncbi:hypothetical protein [Solidesulfovibrio sp.]
MMARQSWTPKRAAAKSRRKIEAARKLLLEIVQTWDDGDNYLVTLVDEVIAPLDALKEAINERPGEDAS